jgi:hypothetical protein
MESAAAQLSWVAQQLQQRLVEVRQVVGETGDITARQSAALQAYKQGIVDVNATVVHAWQVAKQHAIDGSARVDAQIVARATQVEDSLTLPLRITRLEETLGTLSDTLDDLSGTLASFRDRDERRS